MGQVCAVHDSQDVSPLYITFHFHASGTLCGGKNLFLYFWYCTCNTQPLERRKHTSLPKTV